MRAHLRHSSWTEPNTGGLGTRRPRRWSGLKIARDGMNSARIAWLHHELTARSCPDMGGRSTQATRPCVLGSGRVDSIAPRMRQGSAEHGRWHHPAVPIWIDASFCCCGRYGGSDVAAVCLWGCNQGNLGECSPIGSFDGALSSESIRVGDGVRHRKSSILVGANIRTSHARIETMARAA